MLASLDRTLAAPRVTINYSARLVVYGPKDAGVTYEDTLRFLDEMVREGKLPGNATMSTAAHEVAVIHSYESKDEDPRKAEEYFGILGNANERIRMPGGWMWTCTGLLVPDGWENARLDGRTYPRIIVVNGEKKEVRQIPPGGIVTEWDEKYGVPLKTRKPNPAEPYKGHAVHFEFYPTLNEVMIGLRWAVDYHEYLTADDAGKKEEEREEPGLNHVCLGMHARLGSSIRLDAVSFRPVLEIAA